MTKEVLPLFQPVDTEELKRLDKLDREREAQPWHPREVYLTLPKGYGAVPSEQLLEIATQLDTSPNARDLAVAGSALIESRLFSPYCTEETAEDDEFIVRYGNHLMQQAAQARWDELERGFLHYDDQTSAIRAEVSAAFGPIYVDLLRGEVTHSAREETYAKLAYWGQYILKHGERHGSYGLAYEIATLMGGLTDENVLLPATPRGDNGVHNGDTTHDFSYLTLRDGAIDTVISLELKNEADDDRRLNNARRYDQREVVVLKANDDLSLYKADLQALFSQRSLTYTARRNLAGIRKGLYARANQADREFGARYQ